MEGNTEITDYDISFFQKFIFQSVNLCSHMYLKVCITTAVNRFEETKIFSDKKSAPHFSPYVG